MSILHTTKEYSFDHIHRRYISRSDNSPLHRALVLWRTAYIESHAPGDISPPRASSPFSEDEGLRSGDDDALDAPSFTSELEEPATAKPPTSSSWVQWWNRSRRKDRPELKPMASEPSKAVFAHKILDFRSLTVS